MADAATFLRQRPAKTPDATPSASISSPSAHDLPQLSDGRACSAHTTRDRNSRHPDLSSTSPFALIPVVSYNTIAQLRLLTSRLLRRRRRLDRFLLPAQLPPNALHALLTEPTQSIDGRPRLARTFAVVVFAVLANHVRRMLIPALAVGGFSAPIATLKLAAGSPAIFLREEMEVGVLGRGAGWEAVCKVIGDVVGGTAARVAVAGSFGRRSTHELEVSAADQTPGPDSSPENVTAKHDGWKAIEPRGRKADKARVVVAVVYCVWVLGCAEYIHARAVHAVAVGIAYAKLICGGPAHRQALREILLPSTSSGVVKVLGSHLELAYYIAYGLVPLLCLAARSALGLDPTRSRPGLVLLIAGWAWGTGYVARYSNKYYIGLEMSGLLLVLWWISAAAAVFAWGSLRTRFRA